MISEYFQNKRQVLTNELKRYILTLVLNDGAAKWRIREVESYGLWCHIWRVKVS